MRKSRLLDILLPNAKKDRRLQGRKSWLRNLISGSFFRMSDLRGNTSISDIKTQIDTMRALAKDSQINTALSYYATDATTTNTDGQIIWATSPDKPEIADIINKLFKRWDINSYARDHILELATIGNLYIPTTEMYRDENTGYAQSGVALDNNTIPAPTFDIVPSYKIPPEDLVHVWYRGKPEGYIYQPEDGNGAMITYPESSIIHFSLGGLLGDYTLDTAQSDGSVKTWDIQFAEPLMSRAVQPTQTLSLLEDAVILSSLTRVVRFICVDCGNSVEDEEIRAILQQIKDTVEQQLSINTGTGDVQSFVNPQSPNNLVYVPQVNGKAPIDITDLNMVEPNEADNKLLNYYQDKKLSVLGVPKEAMNFSSPEGLSGSGPSLSQRSTLYANILNRLETAYMSGWTKAFNTYFSQRGLSEYADSFKLHMSPIITTNTTIQFEKRDAALNQATSLVALLKDMGVTKKDNYLHALVEILTEVFPQIGADAANWDINVESTDDGGGGSGF